MSSHYILEGKLDLISHRGGALEFPENTILAFQKSLEIYNAYSFELDVHCTKDGEVVVFHDPTLERTTNGIGEIRSKLWSELNRLDAGYNFTLDFGQSFPHRGKNIGISRLEEVLLKFPKTRMSIEVKSEENEGVRKVVDTIRKVSAMDRVILASGSYAILKKLRNFAPEAVSGYSAKEVKTFLILSRLRMSRFETSKGRVLQVPMWARGLEILTPQFIDAAHKKNLKVHAWTIDDSDSMKRLIDMGIDGIITDAPSLLVGVARELKKI